MKVCEVCGEEIHTRDSENRCRDCEDMEQAKAAKKRQAREARRARDQVMRDLGLAKVRGALGGTYWE